MILFMIKDISHPKKQNCRRMVPLRQTTAVINQKNVILIHCGSATLC